MYQYAGTQSGSGNIEVVLEKGSNTHSINTEIGTGNMLESLYDATIEEKGNTDKTNYQTKIV